MDVAELDEVNIRKMMIGETKEVDNTGHQMIAEMEEMIEKAWGKKFSGGRKELNKSLITVAASSLSRK